MKAESTGQTLAVAAFLDELARAGTRHMVVSPGSRSTPLAVLAAEHPALTVWLNIDERSAGFFALGLAKARREPVALICTSGTAAANYWPAVAEADLSRVPLIVLTADRPHELRDVGAPQTILQAGMYGKHVKWDADMPVPDGAELMIRHFRTAAARAAQVSVAAPAGPVHVNFPLREPLLPELGQPGLFDTGRSGDGPAVQTSAGRQLPDELRIAELALALAKMRRGVFVCGPLDEPGFPRAMAALAERAGWPVLADPLSQLRTGGHGEEHVMEAYDAFLRDERTAEALKPDVIVRFGAMPVSKPFLQYLNRHRDSRYVVVDTGGWREPALQADELVFADPVLFCRLLADGLDNLANNGELPARNADWLATWQRINRATLDVLVEQGREQAGEPLFEGRVFSELHDLMPPDSVLMVGNSMPVRDLDTFFACRREHVRLVGNRGANGIDGLISTALGFSAAGEKTVLVLGDLSFFHDMNGLLAAKLNGLDLTIVLVNNDGGGIFSFLPQTALPAHFETLFGTPTGLDFAKAAALYDAVHTRAEDWPAFRTAFARAMAGTGLHIIEVNTDRACNVTQHRRVWQQVAEKLATLPEG